MLHFIYRIIQKVMSKNYNLPLSICVLLFFLLFHFPLSFCCQIPSFIYIVFACTPHFLPCIFLHVPPFFTFYIQVFFCMDPPFFCLLYINLHVPPKIPAIKKINKKIPYGSGSNSSKEFSCTYLVYLL